MISAKGDDPVQLEVIKKLRELTVSDLEPDITEDFIYKEVSRISMHINS